MTKNALLNYTTTIDTDKTVSQITAILVAHGAQSILAQYDGGRVVAIAFQVKRGDGHLSIKLPADPDAVQKVLNRQHMKGKVMRRHTTLEHAERVAWRIVKDWVEVQMAMLETEQVKMEQIFLAYVIAPDGRTLFQYVEDRNLLLTEGKG